MHHPNQNLPLPQPQPQPQLPMPVTVPSWVMPGTVAENMSFTCNKVQGLMLCCFESSPRLPLDLPVDLPLQPTHSHAPLTCIHLPVDLPWERGGAVAGAVAIKTVKAAIHLLQPDWRAVLHLPPSTCPPRALAGFVQAWQDTGWPQSALRLENTPTDTPDALYRALAVVPLPVCLDVAHAALMRWDVAALGGDMAERVRMIHWSAPSGIFGTSSNSGRDAHRSLAELNPELHPMYRAIARRWTEVEDVIEVFDWNGIMTSWPVLRTWRTAG